MPDFPTSSDLFREARDEALLRNAKVSRDAAERRGSDANILLAGIATVGDQVVGQVAQLSGDSFLNSAKVAALDRLVFDRYGLVRKPAAASLGTATFSTTVPAPTTFTIPTGIRLQTPDGLQFITTESSVFVAGAVGPLPVAVRSVLAGPAQNIKSGTLTSILTAIQSQPSDLRVTNPFATAGADDVETDDSLRDRGRRFFTTARRGTLGAIEAAALGVPGVRKATAFEAIDALGRPARFVQLVVADSFTAQFAQYDVVPPRYEVQSQLLATTVFNALSDVRPAGIYVQVFVGNVILQPIQLALTFNAGADVNAAALQARATMVNYVNGLAPGADFVLQDANDAISATPGLAPSGNAILSPPGNIAVKPLQVLRTALGLVTAVAAQTNQPIITGSNPDAYILAGV